ncbi:hypothetical protein [Halalkalibacter urbisdiaboli]|uniref:hypothetical protein n=1 Tax=Halalkalibacter urbisdiaboli TaxID=1960589 RepID=UPI000B43BD43|nr:hypothetical protein [Halalkalibacter urbisdiaboli]
MNQVEIYITGSNDHGLTPGYIYPQDEHIAESLVKNGQAKKVDYATLTDVRTKMDAITAEHEAKIEAVKADTRFTDEGKAEQIEALEEQYHAEMTKQAEEYKRRLNVLKETATEKAQQKGDSGISPDEARQEAGINLAKIDRLPLSTVNSHTDSLELSPVVAREMLANWMQIKSAMTDKLSAEPSLQERQSLQSALNAIHSKLESLSQTDGQREASHELRMLEALEQRGTYTPVRSAARSYYQQLKAKGRVR